MVCWSATTYYVKSKVWCGGAVTNMEPPSHASPLINSTGGKVYESNFFAPLTSWLAKVVCPHQNLSRATQLPSLAPSPARLRLWTRSRPEVSVLSPQRLHEHLQSSITSPTPSTAPRPARDTTSKLPRGTLNVPELPAIRRPGHPAFSRFGIPSLEASSRPGSASRLARCLHTPMAPRPPARTRPRPPPSCIP